ncbi:MAG: DCC1-like thiol-disulfide oxidoreductase family protein [Phycisphaerales bacterium]|jgi:predicted DCC family thiol-disulfide oxidoreductase YuxK
MPDPHPIVLFDGTCAFCDRTVRLLTRLDRRDVLRYAPLASEAGRFLLDRFDVPESIDSIVLIHPNGRDDHALVESNAAIAVARRLGFPWSLAAILKIIPRPLRDACYRFIARHRYTVFGRVERCSLPTETQRRLVVETKEAAMGLIESDGGSERTP